MSGDELARLLRPQHQPTARFGQGRLLSWNPDTFESIVQWNGARLVNPPVLAGMDALTFRSGMDVLLIGWDGGGRRGAQDWAILSRAIEPGPAAAEEAIEPMRTRLAQQIAAEVFADRIHIGFLAGAGTRHSTSYGDLTPISVPGPGPSVTAEITSGSAIVMLSCRMDAHLGTGTSNTGFMSFEVSGATSIAAQDGGYELGLSGPDSAGVGVGPISASRVRAIAGLNPGENTFTAKFRTAFDTTSAVTFSSLEIVVIAL